MSAEVVDVLATIPENADFHGYSGVATLAVAKTQADQLKAPFPDEAYQILPTGEVYVSQVHYRRRLNEVFGPGAWAMVPRGGFVAEENGKKRIVYREYALVVNGRFISEAVGEQEYFATSSTYATACEGVKSSALTRCCKDLGIASECWDRNFTQKFQEEKCVLVLMDEGKPQWRRKDAKPLRGERGPVRPEKKAEEKKPEQAPAPRVTVPLVSEEQRNRLFAAARQSGKPTEIIKEILKKVGGVENSQDLPAEKFSTVIQAIEAK